MTNRFQNLKPMLHTLDIDMTIEWYVSVLGFQCLEKDGNGWCRLGRDNVELMFMRNEHLGTPMATVAQYIYVENVMQLWESIKDNVDAEWGPEEMPYGMLEFAIKDPNGYLLSFGQSV